MLPGETILSGANPNCPYCGKLLVFEVLKSNAGYYIGTQCCCGPYSRETDYWTNGDDAQIALDDWQPLTGSPLARQRQ